MAAVADYLSALIKQAGLTRSGLARLLRRHNVDITDAGVSRWFRGETRPSADIWPVVLDLLCVHGADRDYANRVYFGDAERVA